MKFLLVAATLVLWAGAVNAHECRDGMAERGFVRRPHNHCTSINGGSGGGKSAIGNTSGVIGSGVSAIRGNVDDPVCAPWGFRA